MKHWYSPLTCVDIGYSETLFNVSHVPNYPTISILHSNLFYSVLDWLIWTPSNALMVLIPWRKLRFNGFQSMIKTSITLTALSVMHIPKLILPISQHFFSINRQLFIYNVTIVHFNEKMRFTLLYITLHFIQLWTSSVIVSQWGVRVSSKQSTFSTVYKRLSSSFSHGCLYI